MGIADLVVSSGKVRRGPPCSVCGVMAGLDVAEQEALVRLLSDHTVRYTELMLEAEVATFVHRAFGGSPIKPSTVRQWVRRGVIEASGKDQQGRSLYSREAVVWAVSKRAEATP